MAGDVSLVEVMARLVAAFALIIGMLGGAVFVFRRRGMLRVTGGGSPLKCMQVVERQNLTRSSSVAVVRVGTSSYLVGATDHAVSMLADVTEPVGQLEKAADRTAGATDPDDAATQQVDLACQRTGMFAGRETLHSPRMDLVGAILQRMNRQV